VPLRAAACRCVPPLPLLPRCRLHTLPLLPLHASL